MGSFRQSQICAAACRIAAILAAFCVLRSAFCRLRGAGRRRRKPVGANLKAGNTFEWGPSLTHCGCVRLNPSWGRRLEACYPARPPYRVVTIREWVRFFGKCFFDRYVVQLMHRSHQGTYKEHIKNIPLRSGFGKREPHLARTVALCALARDKARRLGYRRDMTHTAATFFWFFGYRKPLAVGGSCSI